MKFITLRVVALALMALFTAQVQAVALTPSDCVIGSNCWTDSGTPSNPNAAEIGALVGETDLTLFYKADFGGGEDGVFAGSYSTVFSGTETDPDPSQATITFDGGAVIDCSVCYLSIKDGNANPDTYVFDISGWDGVSPIVLTGFWADIPGSISNVAIWGPSANVPAPATLGLLGMGLLLLAATRRRAS